MIIEWPQIADVDSKTLTDVVLELVLWSLQKRVRENGIAPNRGDYPDEYNREVGLPVPLDPELPGFAWCTSGLFAHFKEAARQKRIVNPFPKTAKAVHVARDADAVCRVSNAARGVVYVLDHGNGWKFQHYDDNGHCGIYLRAGTDVGDADEISFNTNAAGSREGNCVAQHHGEPEVTHGGVRLMMLDFNRAPTRAS